MKEKIVSKNLRVPSCAILGKGIWCPKHGFVGATMTCEGNEITFFRTDFLSIERIAWYFAEKFSDKDYHENVGKEVLESIEQNGGFFLSKHFLTNAPDGKVKSCEGTAITRVNFSEAKRLANSIEIPELQSDLMYGVIYDVLGSWLIETGTLTKEEWVNSPSDEEKQKELLTRDQRGWCLQELVGNIFQKEWTQEKYSSQSVVVREGVPFTDGEGNYPSRMRITASKDAETDAVIRALLYFK